MRYLTQEQFAPAHAQLEALQATAPDHVGTHLLAAEIAWSEDRVRDAAAFALDAARLAADDPELICDVVANLLRVGEVVSARQCLEQPALAGALPCMCLVRLADFRLGFGEYADSLALLDKALATGSDAVPIHFYRGRLLTFLGRLEDAESEFQLSLRITPTHGEAALPLVTLRTQTRDSNYLAELTTGLQSVARGTRDHAAFEFARYKTLEDLGRYDEAWQALARANAIMHARTCDDALRQNASLQRSVDYYSSHSLSRAVVTHARPQPIFIIGLPRSGTTVLERMLGNHTQIVAAGELFDFGRQLQWAGDHRHIQDDTFLQRLGGIDLGEVGQRYLAQTQWRAYGARYFIDKQTSNWMLAGLIYAALPGARILHLVREPTDVCFSIFRAMFGDAYAIANDLPSLAAHYKKYRHLMARWHALAPDAILNVSYDELVREPEATLRKVLAHCGLTWEPACLDLAANQNPVSTLSAAQIREPLHARSPGAWRRYETQLLRLSTTLAETSPDTLSRRHPEGGQLG
ncbi:MAG: sulfotransferase [Rhodanobacteraceae bacterium]